MPESLTPDVPTVGQGVNPIEAVAPPIGWTPEQDIAITSYAVDDGGSGGYNRTPVDNDSESEKDQKSQREATGSTYSYYKEREIGKWENKFNWGQSSGAGARSGAEQTQNIMNESMTPSTKVNVGERIYMYASEPGLFPMMYDGMGSVWGRGTFGRGSNPPRTTIVPKTITATQTPNLPHTGTYLPAPSVTNPYPTQNALGVPGVTVQMMNEASDGTGAGTSPSNNNSPQTPSPCNDENPKPPCATADGKFVSEPTGQGGENPVNSLDNGKIKVDDLMKTIPKDAENTFKGTGDLPQGFKYSWSDVGTKNTYSVWFHGPNPNAPSGSYSANNWTVRVTVKNSGGTTYLGDGGRLLTQGEAFTNNGLQQTHIPLIW